jgi:hypothetical protein
MERVAEYEEWIKKCIELNGDWTEEIEYMIFLRGEIHESVAGLEPAEMEKLRKLDGIWQSWAVAHTDHGFSLERSRDGVPFELWWNWIDQISGLTESQRSTL